MKIVLATPLYPPDIAESAAYVKELATRLRKEHDVTIVAYAHIPERVPGVAIVTVEKRQPLPLRLTAYFGALWRASRGADILFVENGASVELPAALVSLFRGQQLTMHLGDIPAYNRSEKKLTLRMIGHFARARSHAVIAESPLERPEILPFVPLPTEAQATYEASWGAHLATLATAFTYARKR